MARWAASAAFFASWTSLSSAFNCGSTAAAAPRSALRASVSGSARSCVKRGRDVIVGRRAVAVAAINNSLAMVCTDWAVRAVLSGFGPRKVDPAATTGCGEPFVKCWCRSLVRRRSMVRQTAKIFSHQHNQLAAYKHTSKPAKNAARRSAVSTGRERTITARLGPIKTHTSGGCTPAPHLWLAG